MRKIYYVLLIIGYTCRIKKNYGQKSVINNTYTHGQSLVELLITIGMAAILMPAFLLGFSATRGGKAQQDQRIQAINYEKEAEEAVRVIRDNGWSSLTSNGNGMYHPAPSGSTWVLAQGSETIPGTSLTRSIDVEDALRDPVTHAISISGVDDPSTKAITITVSWSQPIINSSVSQVLYLTRHDNISVVDTTLSDFSSGDTSGGTVVLSGGIYGDGAVVLGGGGASDWCKPNGAGIIKYKTSTNANEVAISAVASPASGTPSYAYTTFGYSANGDTLDKWNISDPTPAPGTPSVSTGGSYNPTPQEKSYGVFGTPTAIFLASNRNGKTVDIIDPSSLGSISTFADSGGEAGESLSAGNTNSGYEGFVTACTLSGTACSGNYKLYSFDYHTTPLTNSRTQNGVVALGGEGKRIVVVNKLAFVATSSTTSQLQIFDVGDPANIKPITLTYNNADGSHKTVGQYQTVPQRATDIAVDNTGNYAYVVTSNSGSDPDIFKIDVSGVASGQTAANVDIVATTTTGSMSPTGVILVSQNHLVVVGSGGSQYQVMFNDLSSCPNGTGLLSLGSGIVAKAVSAVSEADGDNYAYVLTNDSGNELQIIPGGEGAGTGGGGGGGNGTFISRGLPVPNLTSNATFNNYFPIADTPAPTSITYQVGVAPTCSSTFSFIGPGGTTASTDTFATSSAIALTGPSGYSNPGECFKYKAILNSGGSTTSSPVLYQVTVNYSP